MGKIGNGVQCFRILLILCNILFLLSGLAILGIGYYQLLVGREFTFLTGNYFVSGAALLITCSVTTLVVTVLGFLGGIVLWRPVLVTYFIALVIIVLLNIAIGITGFVQVGLADRVQVEVASRFDDIIARYVVDRDSPDFDQGVNDAVSFMQRTFACCGSSGPQSWIDLNQPAVEESINRPPLCAPCDSTIDPMTCGQYTFETTYTIPSVNLTFEALNKGCVDASQDTLDRATNSYAVVGGIGIAFGAFELIGIPATIGLIYGITKSHQHNLV